ncbi:signal peptidase I [Microbacterium sp. NPDC016588]
MSGTSTPSPSHSRLRRIRRSPLTHLALAFVVLALVQLFLVKPFQVPSESMSPTLETGDRVVASRVDYALSAPGEGDVAVFSRPDTWEAKNNPSPLRVAVGWVGDLVGFGPSNLDALVKRIIGEPGTTVQCCTAEGTVTVNGFPLDEGYIVDDLPFSAGELDCSTVPASTRCFGPIVVPDGQYLVLGDNRANSADSVIACRGAPAATSCARFVPRDRIVGKVFAIVWPLDRALGPLDGG